MEQRAKSAAEQRAKQAEDNKEKNLTDWELTPEMKQRLAAVEVKEKALEQKFDAVADTVAKRMGYEKIPWFKLTWFLLWLYAGITNLVLFYRPDFINLTVCVVALYMMFNTDRITRNRFRLLVLGIFISLIIDVFWFWIKHSEYASEPKADSGMEKNVKRFSLMMSYASFILRVRFVRLIILDFRWLGILERLDGLRKDHPESARHGCITSETKHRQEQRNVPPQPAQEMRQLV